jgi:hypothetical protein
MNITKKIVKWHGQIELSYISSNRNRVPTLAPQKEASKVSLRGCAHAQSPSKGLVGSGG